MFDIIDWLVANYGYKNVIMIKDFILCLAGVFIGSIIHSLLSGNVVRKLEKYEKLGEKVVAISMKSEEGETHFVNPHSFEEAVETWLSLILMPIFKIRRYTLRDQRRTKRFVYCLYVIEAIVILSAILFISHPIIVDLS